MGVAKTSFIDAYSASIEACDGLSSWCFQAPSSVLRAFLANAHGIARARGNLEAGQTC
jgi:hypothetical protein